MQKIVPVILCGGSGSRLWPLSRQSYPKQLLSLNGTGSLLQQTVLRLSGMSDIHPPLVICNEEHRFLVAEQLREIGQTSAKIILEPVGRNTAPAATLASLYVQEHYNDSLCLILPADHLIGDVTAFYAAICVAKKVALEGYLVAMGVTAERPEIAYGYIKMGDALSGEMQDSYKVEIFIEKPGLDTAEKFASSGEYLWNVGIYLVRTEVFLEQVEQFAPHIYSVCQRAYGSICKDLDFLRVDKSIFANCSADSIDYAVMEKTSDGAAVILHSDWSDVGSWKTLWEVGEQDQDGNVIKGDVVAHDSSNCYIHATSRLVATAGLTDHIIVETDDAVLVADKDNVQDVRYIVAILEQEGRKETNLHRRVYRPWGSYETIADGERFLVKLIRVKPGASLSLQMHHHRAEHWIVVKGTAQVTREDTTFMVSENESTFIPLGTKHRLENPGIIALELIEIQSGSYLEEDDIIRFQDD